LKKYFFIIIGFIFSLQAHAFDDEMFLPYDFTQTRYLIIYKDGYFQRYLPSPFGFEKVSEANKFYFSLISSISKQPLTNKLLIRGEQINRDHTYTVILVSPNSSRHMYIAENWIADAYRKVTLSPEESLRIKNFLDNYAHPATALPLEDYQTLVNSLQSSLGNQIEDDINFVRENTSVIEGIKILEKRVNANQSSNQPPQTEKLESALDAIKKSQGKNSGEALRDESVSSITKKPLIAKESSQADSTITLESFKSDLKSALSSQEGGATTFPNTSLSSSPNAKISRGTAITDFVENQNYKIMIGIIVLMLAGFFLLRRSE
jgi:hypothetical protein